MLAQLRLHLLAVLFLALGLPALALTLTAPARDAQWTSGNRETVSWDDAPGGRLTFQLQIVNKAQKLFYDIHAADFGAGSGAFSYRPTQRDVQNAEWAGTYLRVVDGGGNELASSDRFDIRL